MIWYFWQKKIRWLLKRLEKYCDRKGLKMNTRKTKNNKILEGRRERGQNKVVVERNRVLEEVKEVSYLGYRFKKNRRQEVHVRERE